MSGRQAYSFLLAAIAAASAVTACGGADTDTPTPPQNTGYYLDVDPENAVIHARLELSAADEGRLILRGTHMQLEAQVSNVRCDGVELISDGDGWPLPPGCVEVSWTIAPDRPEVGVTPSDQRSLAMPDGWLLISEPTSLLRLETDHGQPTTIQISDPQGHIRAGIIPPLSAPPGFYISGNAPSLIVGDGTPQLIYVADDLDAVLSVVDPVRHYQAIEWFTEVLGLPNVRDSETLTVVWFGAPRENREASGAAGHDVLLANYIAASDAPEPFERALTNVLVLHEQFHQIDAGPGARPHWVNESLTNYYALKAARHFLPDSDGVDAVWAFFIQTDAPVEIGLLEAQRRIDEEQDYSGYMAFYSTGAAFWYELDDAMRAATGARRSLDDILPLVVSTDFPPGSGLPEALREALLDIPSSEIERIERRYLHGYGGEEE